MEIKDEEILIRSTEDRSHFLNAKCYACNAPATSMEHVPPKCFFPDNQRSDPMTVPSCVIHNRDKSSDDEYTACFLAMNAENSDVATDLLKGPRLKEMMRREASLGVRIFSNARPAMNNNGDKTLAINYEMHRVNKVIEYIARAVYFKHMGGEKWFHGCVIHSPRLYHDSGWSDEIPKKLGYIAAGFDELRRSGDMCGSVHGSHPSIFWYQIIESEPNAPQVRMMFYGTFEFFAFTT